MFRTNFDKNIDIATSHLLLEPEWPSIMLICDAINQKDTTPKSAFMAIKKKMNSTNPHTAYYSLLVLESVVKNCGAPMHDEVFTKENCTMFSEFLQQTPHENVRAKMLELVQTWAYAFRSSDKYQSIKDTMTILKAKGHPFPELKEADAMFSMDTAPHWTDGKKCHRCRDDFTFTNRKHHCRNCGQVFCGQCTSKQCPLPKFGIEKEVRVCDGCFAQLQRPTAVKAATTLRTAESDLPAEYLNSSLAQQVQTPPRKTEQELKEEEELQLALALSQSEAEVKKQQNYNNSVTSPQKIMSEIEKEMPEEEQQRKYLPNATHITNEALERFPNIEHFFEILVKDTVIDIKEVGIRFQYHYDIIKNRYYSHHGLFMDYFIRKHLSNQYNIDIIDGRTEHILENPDEYIIGSNTNLHNAIKKHYDIFKDPQTKAMDIIKSVKIVSLSHSIFFHYAMPKSEYVVNENNLREVIKYLQSLPYTSVDLNPWLGCEYFNADADLIFDDDVIYEIKTSKYKSLCYDESEIPLSKFYQPIIYGFGFYKKTGKKIKKFKIYNPLLSYEYSIELNNIDFVLFEKVLKRDVDVYSRYREFVEENMILDLTLFGDEANE